MSEQNDRIVELLEEIVKWVRVMGLGQVKATLPVALDTEKKALVYHLSDGKNSSVNIASLTGINQPRVTELWKEWASLGLGEQVSAKGGSRFKKSFDLKMFDISVPDTKNVMQKTELPQEKTNGDEVK
jgi:hypothetical protein